MCDPYDKTFPTVPFEHVTLTVTFDLLFQNFNIGHNFFTLRDRALIFGMFVPYDKAFDGTINFGHVTLTMTFHILLLN